MGRIKINPELKRISISASVNPKTKSMLEEITTYRYGEYGSIGNLLDEFAEKEYKKINRTKAKKAEEKPKTKKRSSTSTKSKKTTTKSNTDATKKNQNEKEVEPQ